MSVSRRPIWKGSFARIATVVGAAAIAVGLGPTAANAQMPGGCSAILANGIYDDTSTVSNVQVVETLRNFFRKVEYETSNRAKDDSIKWNDKWLGPYGNMDAEKEKHLTEAEAKSLGSELWQLLEMTKEGSSQLTALSHKVSAVIAAAWGNCMADGYGFAAVPHFGPNKNEILLELRYRPTNPRETTSAELIMSDKFWCEFDGQKKSRGTITRISAARKMVKCGRPANASGQIGISTTVLWMHSSSTGQGAIQWPAIESSQQSRETDLEVVTLHAQVNGNNCGAKNFRCELGGAADGLNVHSPEGPGRYNVLYERTFRYLPHLEIEVSTPNRANVRWSLSNVSGAMFTIEFRNERNGLQPLEFSVTVRGARLRK